MAQLRARECLFWLVFTPLAVDADAAAMEQVLATIRAQVPAAKERAELYAALLVMADLDPWGHTLRKEITAMLETRAIAWVPHALRGAPLLGRTPGGECV